MAKATRGLILFLVLAMVAAACGRSGSKETGGGTTSTTAASASSADFGTLKDVCRPGHPSGSPDQGVTPTSVRVATFSDPNNPARPGLNQEFFDLADVFSQWCNDHGGINGRKLVVDKRDAAFVNDKQRMIESCKDDFIVAGGGAVFDDAGEPTRLSCLLPAISAYRVTAAARGADLQVQPVPNGLEKTPLGIYTWLGKKFPGSSDAVGILTGNLPTLVTQAKMYEEAAKSLGWNVVYNDQYSAAGVSDWTPYTQAMKSKGVKGLIYVGEPEGMAKMELSLKAIGYYPQWIKGDPNMYDEKLVDTGQGAIKNTFLVSSFYPFEDASTVPALSQYIDMFKKYKPNGTYRTYLALQAMSAWLLFATSADKCGNDLTRKCVYDNAKSVTSWTGGGLHAKTDPAGNETSQCFAVIEAEGTKFTLADVNPNEGIFNCSPANVYALKGDYGQGATLASVGKSLSDLK